MFIKKLYVYLACHFPRSPAFCQIALQDHFSPTLEVHIACFVIGALPLSPPLPHFTRHE